MQITLRVLVFFVFVLILTKFLTFFRFLFFPLFVFRHCRPFSMFFVQTSSPVIWSTSMMSIRPSKRLKILRRNEIRPILFEAGTPGWGRVFDDLQPSIIIFQILYYIWKKYSNTHLFDVLIQQIRITRPR